MQRTSAMVLPPSQWLLSRRRPAWTPLPTLRGHLTAVAHESQVEQCLVQSKYWNALFAQRGGLSAEDQMFGVLPLLPSILRASTFSPSTPTGPCSTRLAFVRKHSAAR